MQTPSNAPHVLVVDDDERIRDLLRRYLTQEGLQVTSAPDAATMDAHLLNQQIDIIVLDLMLPGEDGLSICQRLRQSQLTTPIIILTAKSDDADAITALDNGADDYLAKPFNPRTLLARIHAVMRRHAQPSSVPGQLDAVPQKYVFGHFDFDPTLRRLQKNGEPLALTSGEFSMLKVFIQNVGKPLSRNQLATMSRGRPFEPYDRSLDVQVSRLRKIIEEDPANPRYIQTVWGVGYVFVPEEKKDDQASS